MVADSMEGAFTPVVAEVHTPSTEAIATTAIPITITEEAVTMEVTIMAATIMDTIITEGTGDTLTDLR
jgi:hypothetical protein